MGIPLLTLLLTLCHLFSSINLVAGQPSALLQTEKEEALRKSGGVAKMCIKKKKD